MDGEFPNLSYLWNHPDLSQKTKEKIAYHNGKEYFQLNRPASAQAGRKANCDNENYRFVMSGEQ